MAATTAVITAAAEARVQRFVFASSIMVHLGSRTDADTRAQAGPTQLPVSEASPLQAFAGYAMSKLHAERLLVDATTRPRTLGFIGSAVSLRFPSVLPEPRFRQLAEQRPAAHRRDRRAATAFSYIHAQDLAQAFANAAETEYFTGGHHAFLVSAPDPFDAATLDELIDTCYPDLPGADDARARGSLVDCTAAHTTLGFVPSRLLRDAPHR